MNRLVAITFTAVFAASLAACDNPAENKPVATVADTAKAPAATAKPATAAPANAVTYEIDSKASKVEFVGSKVTGSHTGTFSGVSGTITVPEGKLDQGRASIKIDNTTVNTDQEKLTAHLKSPDFFDTQKFPQSSFEITSITPGGEKGATHTVSGTLDLHGVKKAISFPATLTSSGDTVQAKAEFVINRKDFGIVYAGKADDLIRDEVVIKLDITGRKKA